MASTTSFAMVGLSLTEKRNQCHTVMGLQRLPNSPSAGVSIVLIVCGRAGTFVSICVYSA